MKTSGLIISRLRRSAASAWLAPLDRLEHDCFDSAVSFPRQRISYLLRHARSAIYVATEKGALVGQVTVLFRRTTSGETARIYSIAVHRKWRRQGVADALLRSALARLKQIRVGRVFAEVEPKNRASLRLFQRNGFLIIKELPDYHGPGRSALKLVRELNR